MKIKRKIRSFEAEPDVDLMLESARISGLTIGEIVNAALHKHGAEIISEITHGKIQSLSRNTKYPPTISKIDFNDEAKQSPGLKHFEGVLRQEIRKPKAK